MSKIILINHSLAQYRIALLVDDAPVEIHIVDLQNPSLVGCIYWAKVERVLTGMQSAFVNIGEDKLAFLKLTHQSTLRAGDFLLVQVSKDAIYDKGARLTTKIALAGHYLVYLPMSQADVGVSNKLPTSQKSSLKQHLTKLLHTTTITGGLIARSTCEAANQEQLLAEVKQLSILWQTILAQKPTKRKPWQLYQPSPLTQCLLDWADNKTQVIIDDMATYQTLATFCQTWLPAQSFNLCYHTDKTPLFDKYHVEDVLQNALKKQVSLKSGGYLLIEQTEAMTTIDVNSGTFVGKQSLEQSAYQINLQAAQAIAYQLRLRNISGMIVIDFIDMADSFHQNKVQQALKHYLADDSVKSSILQTGKLGLVLMTRERTRLSLSQTLRHTCPICQGLGEVKNAQALALDAYHHTIKMAQTYPHCQSLTIITNEAVANCLQPTNALQMLSTLLQKPVLLRIEVLTANQPYQIIVT